MKPDKSGTGDWLTKTIARASHDYRRPKPAITLHAIERFQERFVEPRERDQWNQHDVRGFLRRVILTRPAEAVLTYTSPRRREREWRFFVRGLHNGVPLYIITDFHGRIAITVLTEEMFLQWPVIAHALAVQAKAADYVGRDVKPDRKWVVS